MLACLHPMLFAALLAGAPEHAMPPAALVASTCLMLAPAPAIPGSPAPTPAAPSLAEIARALRATPANAPRPSRRLADLGDSLSL